MWRKLGFVREPRNVDVIKTIPFSSHSRPGDRWTSRMSPMTIGRGYIALAVLVLALLPQFCIILLPQPFKSWDCRCISPYLANTHLIPKKRCWIYWMWFFFFLTTSIHLQYHLDGDLLKMGYIYHIGVCTVISALLCLFRTSEEIGGALLEKIHPCRRCQ